VADYTPAAVADHKIKKDTAILSIPLAPTLDILKAVAALPSPPFTVGFAAETNDLEAYARRKLEEKKLDMVAANYVGQARGGFDSDENALRVFCKDGEADLPMATKTQIATQLIDLIADYYRAKNPT
jgi:phosphopantothenoylcysteine decarboxylase/phosphopantothenate--cysteine ligase